MSTTAPGADDTTTQNTAQGGVWDTLVGQHAAVQTLSRAVGGHGMTHAWLFTGPPGSGRSNAAMAFAAALQCEQGGCGHCLACTTALAGSHADVSVTRTETAVIHVRTIRELVMRATLSPAGGRW
ncbi:MAG TPA: DNA polymerase III subunit delta', partial [Methylomirabilota bacterium]|nr:DNA polymerase III subunit delta' [Methylomirabilota bacterium]